MSEHTDIVKTSYLRGNIISWLPIKTGDTVLYFGEETDGVAKTLFDMGAKVFVGKLESMKEYKDTFDYVVCLGNLSDISQQYRTTMGRRKEETVAGLVGLKGLLNRNGRLVLAISNRLGLRYFAGEKEEGSGCYFAGIENESNISCYSIRELKEAVEVADFVYKKFYYPFPDYRFTMSIYSDECLPKKGELIDQVGNFVTERLVLFDEGKAADMLLEEGKFEDFSNSYLIVLTTGEDANISRWEKEQVGFVKFSNDRGEKHNIKTFITISPDGKKHLIKSPDSNKAVCQIENIIESKDVLEKQYQESRFHVNECKRREDGVELEFLKGHTMEEEVDALLEMGQQIEACKKILEVIREISLAKPLEKFQVTEEFTKVFGDVKVPENSMAAKSSDIDMILANILVQGEKWVLIDYEWTFHFPIPLNYILYRTLHYYVNTTAKRRVLEQEELFVKAGITEDEILIYEQMEENFQGHILQGHIPMRELQKEAGSPAYHITSVLNVIDEMERRRALQVYFDRGGGFIEEESIYYLSEALDGTYTLQIPFGEEVRKLRIDPGSQACTVDIRQFCFKEGVEKSFTFLSNGHKIDKNLYLFDTEDPNILFDEIPVGSRGLQIDIRIDSMSQKAAEKLALRIDPKYRFKKLLKKED